MTIQLIIEATFQGETALPKDRFVNVWHVLDDTVGHTAAELAGDAAAKICGFYTDPHSATTVEQYLNSDLLTATLKVYDFAAAKPRPIIYQGTFPLTASVSENLPEEVALVLSAYTDRNLPSHRGRTYIGPFNVSAIQGGGQSRPAAGLISVMAASATFLASGGLDAPAAARLTTVLGIAPSGAGTPVWALYSPKLGTFSAFRNGWVDNEWDGQSRRRVEASARTTF